jgi:RHS repeat-associated protein
MTENRAVQAVPLLPLTPSPFTPFTLIVGSNGEQLDEMNATGAVFSNVFANGQLLATYQFPTANWTFALNDWLGTKRVVANADGTQGETCTGLPFGDGLNCTDTGDPSPQHFTGDPSPQHFTGKERDIESNNDYFGARYYSNNTGRFLSPDWSATLAAVPYAKLGNPQTLNLYSYVGNNPLSAVDPDGHQNTPGGTQCGQVVSIACNNPGDGPAGEPVAELRAAEAQYVAQLQQQSSNSSSNGRGFLSHVRNLLHGHGWNYVNSSVTAETDNRNLKVLGLGANNPAVDAGATAVGAVGALVGGKIGNTVLGPGSIAFSVWNNPSALNVTTNLLSLLPEAGTPSALLGVDTTIITFEVQTAGQGMINAIPAEEGDPVTPSGQRVNVQGQCEEAGFC